MAPKTKEQFTEIRSEKRKLIRETALKLFALDGYYQTSISNIAKTAGISKGLVYNYYTSKEELLRDILNSAIDEIMQHFDTDNDGVLQKHEMRFFLEKAFEIVEQKPGFWRLYYALAAQQSVTDMLNSMYHDYVAKYFSMIENYFEREGSKNPKIDALVLQSLMDGVSLNYINAPEFYPIKELKKRIFEMFNF
jgi:AcrR family transcriptional regulator